MEKVKKYFSIIFDMFRYPFWSLVVVWNLSLVVKQTDLFTNVDVSYKILGQIKTTHAYLLNFSYIWKMMLLFLMTNICVYLCIDMNLSRCIIPLYMDV